VGQGRLIIKASTKQGSAYAAVMVTGSHGVRMQFNYTHDIAGRPGAVSASSPRWLRVTRTGDTITGYESADGNHWTTLGLAHLAGLPSTVQAGLYATSPQYAEVISQSLGVAGAGGGPARPPPPSTTSTARAPGPATHGPARTSAAPATRLRCNAAGSSRPAAGSP
jgi:hypothetical protein